MIAIDGRPGDYRSLWTGFRWQLPSAYNIAWECCGRWAGERSRFALYYEEENGFARAWTFWDLQREANRLSNALAALGTIRNDRVAIILPQRPETGISHLACYQMGAIALPLSPLLDPEALAQRLTDAGATVAIVDQDSLDHLWQLRDKLPHLRHVVAVGQGKETARETGVHRWQRLLEYASSRYLPAATDADDPALIIYTSGDPGDPKGALLAHRTLVGNLPGFVCAHDFYPKPGDLFWSPGDWAESGGLFDALLPTWSLGQPILAYNGRFDPERAYWLIEKYGVRNAFLSPTALKMMVQASEHPRHRYDLDLRSIASGGEAVDATVRHWAREELGVTINEVFGHAEINYVAGGCGAVFPPKPGAMGRPYPGHRVALKDAAGQDVAAGEVGEICVQRSCQGEADPVFMLGYWNNPQATRARYFGEGLEAWGRTGDLARQDEDGYLWYHGRVAHRVRGDRDQGGRHD
ncbi:MAG TPA: AMP-binding protein [Rhodocyclaceae bacterium]|nr:AMP-binding protein [Rhodocyclaceae bacterium]